MRCLIPPLAASLLALVTAGCPDEGGGPPVVDPPVVNLTTPAASVVGQRIRLNITISGCEQVQKVEVLDGELLLRTVSFAANPLELDIEADEIPYTRGVAARPSFVAKAYCSDGRRGVSAPAPALFFPVRSVVQAPGGAMTVPSGFIAQGSGAATLFIGCAEDAAGRRSLVAVDVTGVVRYEQNVLNIPCTQNTTFTELHPATGTRWMFEPYDPNNTAKPSGVTEIDPTLNVKADFAGDVASLGVGPDGDAVVFVSGIIGAGGGVHRIRHNGGSQNYTQAVWSYAPTGPVISDIVVDNSQSVIFSTWYIGPTLAFVRAEKVNYRNGERSALYDLHSVAYVAGGTPAPAVRLNANGSVAYFPKQGTNQNSFVVACATSTPNCTNVASVDGQPAGLVWQTLPLSGNTVVAVPYAKGSRIAAIGAGQAWFLDAYTGAVIGLDAIRPTGALQFLAFQEGRGHDFYLLGGAGSLTELVAIDAAERGELIRYTMPNGSLTIAVDDSGQFWMRIGTALVEGHRLVEYRAAKGQ